MEVEALPHGVTSSKVIGLLEYLDDHHGKEDIYKLAEAIHYELGELLAVIKMTEMLGFVETPGGDVVITDLGRKILKSKVAQRKLIVREQLKRLKIYQRLIEALQKSEEGRLHKQAILEELAALLPHENAEALFKTVVNWGRYAELLGYNPDTQTLYLDEESFPPPQA
ncbi:MAG: AAA-associated domain-containing protein [Nitrospirae bacterium]|nr:AAA-associated domain-containing protein [Candidatus Manganitrophaceae bacterium]